MERKNNGLMVLVIILSILVVGLGGYIIYDKVINVGENNDKVVDNDNIKENNNDNVENDAERSAALKSYYSKYSGKYVYGKQTCTDAEIEEIFNNDSDGTVGYVIIELEDDGTFEYWAGAPCSQGTSIGWTGEYIVDNSYLYLIDNKGSFSDGLECMDGECYYMFGAKVAVYRYREDNGIFTIYAEDFRYTNEYKTKLEKIK